MRRAAHRLHHSPTLEERNRHGEAHEGEPRDRGQDEEPDEEPYRQEGEDADRERVEARAECRPLAGYEHAGTEVCEREERCRQNEDRRLDPGVLSER